MSDTKLREKADVLIAFTQQGPRFIAWVQAVTDALAPATEKAKPGLKDSLWALLSSLRLWKSKGELAMHPSRLDGMIAAVLEDYGGVFIDAPAPKKVAKVENGTVPCPNCGVLGLDEYDHRKLDQFGTAFDKGGGFTCQPAPPEPAEPSWMKVSCMGDVDAGKEDLLCPPPDPKSCWVCRQHEEHCCPEPEPATPVAYTCPNCNRPTKSPNGHAISGATVFSPAEFTCKPAQPEPAAPVKLVGYAAPETGETLYRREPAATEMPEAKSFPVGNCPICGELVAPWNKHAKYEGGYNCEISELDDRHMRLASPEAQAKFRAEMDRRAVEIGTDRLVGVASRPAGEMVTVGVWQLEELLKYADLAEVALRTGFHPPEFLFQPADRSLRQAIDAVNAQRAEWRSQAAQPVASSDAVAELVNVTERTINKLDRTWDQFFAPVRGAITTVRQQAAQPVAVGMTEELEHVLSIAERDLRYKEECFDDSARTVHDERIERLRAAIAAVREQFGKRPKLEKVRGALSWLKMQYEPGSQGYTPNATVWKMTEAALAELDAAEGKGEGRG